MVSSDERDVAATPIARIVRMPPARLQIGIGAAIVLVLAGCAVAVIVAMFSPGGEVSTLGSDDSAEVFVDESGSISIYVHVLGAVTTPGLYELRDGARVVDAVAAAGGFLPEAEQSSLNLARLLSDGEQLYVARLGEAAEGAAPSAISADGIVNINTADAGELETLPRVGPAMSAKIIAWRQANGRFTSVDDLRSVSGIGEKTFAALAPLVTV